MIDLKNEKISTFIREHGIRVPGKVQHHFPDFVAGAIETIAAKRPQTEDSELVAVLDDLMLQWTRIQNGMQQPRPNRVEVPGDALPPRREFDWFKFQSYHNLPDPREVYATTAEEARGYAEQVQRVLNGYRSPEYLRDGWPMEFPDRTTRYLIGWCKAWRESEHRMLMDFGGGEEKKGPPAAYVAHKKAKSAESAEIREAMTKKKK